MATVDVIELRIHRVRQIDVPFEFCYGIEQAGPFLSRMIGGRNVEVVVLLSISDAFRLMGYSEVSVGSTSTSVADIPQMLRLALLCNASKVIIAHNHPTGICLPSKTDVLVTRKVAAAFDLMGIQLVDSLIVTDRDACSIRMEVARHGNN